MSQIFLTWLQSRASLVSFYSQVVTFVDAPNCISSSRLIIGSFHKTAPQKAIKQLSRGRVCLPIEWSSDIITITHISKVFSLVHNHSLPIPFQAFYSLPLEQEESDLSGNICAKTTKEKLSWGTERFTSQTGDITELQIIDLF